MPRIDAPTVAEHRERRREALLAAATALLAEHGVEAVNLAAAGAASGLARSSVYQYFDSTPALLAAVVEDVMAKTGARLAAAMGRADGPSERIDAFVRSTLDTATDPAHRSIHALAGSTLPPECLSRVAELHRMQYQPLLDALVELGVLQPDLTMQLVVAMVVRAAQAVADGAARRPVLARTLDLVHHGIASAGSPAG